MHPWSGDGGAGLWGGARAVFLVRYTVTERENSTNFRGTLKQILVHSCVAENGQWWVQLHFTERPELKSAPFVTWLCSSKDFLLLKLASLLPQASA